MRPADEAGDRPRMVVVSGGGTGIGRAVATRFAMMGDDVLIVGRRRGPLETLANDLGSRVSLVESDLSTANGAARVFDAMNGRTVHVLVAAAGSSAARTTTTLDEVESEWMRDYRANLLTTVLLEHALRPLHSRPGGRVIGIGSIAAQVGSGSGGSYGGAKAALHAWMYWLSRELGPDGITVNIVLPGFIPDTEFFGERITAEFRKERVNRTLVGREGTVDEVAATVAFLASERAAYITGQLIGVSGGTVLGR